MSSPLAEQTVAPEKGRFVRRYLAPLCVLCGLSCALFHQAAAMAPLHADNPYTFRSFMTGNDDYRDFKNGWKPRLFANALAAEVVVVCHAVWRLRDAPGIPPVLRVRGAEQFTVGVWTAGWFIAIGVLYIVAVKERALFYLLGTYAGIYFGYTPGMTVRIFPWDMPIVFVFTVAVLLFVNRRYGWLLALLAVGMGFKETAGVFCLAFLFGEMTWRRRIAMFLGAAAVCTAVKVAIDLYAHAGIPLFTMETVYAVGVHTGTPYYHYNLNTLARPLVFLVNGGTLLAFLILPAPDRPARAMKLIAAVFVICLMVFGLIEEFRVFFEMIPLALYSLGIMIFGPDPPAAAVERDGRARD